MIKRIWLLTIFLASTLYGATPVFNTTPTITNITPGGGTINVELDLEGGANYVVLPVGATAPNNVQVQSGTDGDDNNAIIKGTSSGSNPANESFTTVITGLYSETNYDVYVVGYDIDEEDHTGANDTEPVKIDLTTSALGDVPDGLQTFIDINILDNVGQTDDGYFSLTRIDGSGNNKDLDADAYGAYINDQTEATTSFTSSIKVAMTVSGYFRITDLTLGEYEANEATAHNNFTDVKVIGYKDGNVVAESTAYTPQSDTYFDDYTDISWDAFSGVNIDEFIVFYTESVGDKQSEFNLINFSIENMSTVTNILPTITNTTANQAVNDTATISPFSGVTLADEEDDNISLTIALDDDAKGSLSSTSIASGTVADVQASLRDIIFTPTQNAVAVGDTQTTTFTITANDGTGDGTNSDTTVISSSINDLPTLTNSTKNTNEDTTISLDSAYFTANFNDVDAQSAISKIQITVLPEYGVLKVSDVNVSLDDEITSTNLANLTYVPTSNYHGTDTFSWKAYDGTAYSTDDANVTITVTSVDDTPIINAVSDFSLDEDFNSHNIMVTVSDVDNDDLKISVAVVNGEGILSIPIVQTDWIPKTDGYGTGAMPMEIQSVLNKNGTTDLNITVEDGTGAKSSTIFTVTINPIDDAPVATNMAATVGDNSKEAFDTFTPTFSDVDGDNPIKLKIETDPTQGYFQTTTDNWETETNISAPFEVDMSDLANYRFNASGLDGVSTDVNWSIMTSIDGTVGNGLWSNTTVGVVTIVDSANNLAPDVNITSGGVDINGTIVTINEDSSTNPIYITFSDDYTPTNFLVGIVQSSDSTKVTQSDFNITKIEDGNISIIISPQPNVYGDVNITLGAFDGDKNSTKSFTLHINSINDIPIALNFQKTINEDTNYSFSTLNPTTIYNDTNDSTQDTNETYPEIFNIISLPAQGILHLGDGIALSADTNISINNLSSLVYTPEDNNFTNVTFNWKAYDGEAWTDSKVATFNITSINDIPTNISLSNTTVAHSAGENGNVGTLSSTDIDNNSFTYSLVAGVGDTNNANFNILETTLRIIEPTSLIAGTYSVRVQTDDGNGGVYSKPFTITVTDDVAPILSSLNPTNNTADVALTSNLIITLNENVEKGTGDILIKKTTDDSIVETIDVTSEQVTISGSTVTINPSNNLDLDTQYYIIIPSGAFTDIVGNIYGGITTTTQWNFKTTNISIILSNNTVVENNTNLTVGTFSSSVTLISGTGDSDNSKFTIVDGTTLNLNSSANYETQSNYTIRVQDDATLVPVIFTINVTDVYESNDNTSDVDGDGIPDVDEGLGDTDGDRIPDYLDTDSDNDGILDSVEYEDNLDTDGDGIPNYKDTDSDDDGILDIVEGTADLDNDGIPNYKDVSSVNPDKKAIIDVLYDITPENFLGDNVSTDEIVSALVFTKPTSAIDLDVDINWSTETKFDLSDGTNTQYLTIENNDTGTVHRSDTEDIIIGLNVVISKGIYNIEKSFILTIVKNNTDLESVQRAWKAFDWFKIQNLNKYQFAVRTDLTLETEGSDGVAISWASNNPSIISTEGVVSRPSEDTKVLLTATFTKGSESKDKTGTVLVKKVLLNCTDILNKAQSQLTIEDIIGSRNRSADTIIDNLTLGTASTFNLEDKDNLTLTYTSDNSALLVNGDVGEVGRHTTQDKDVKLTVKIQKEQCDIPVYKSFNFIIKAMDKNVTRAIINDINDTVSTNQTMLMHFDIALSNDYNYSDATATNTFITESNQTSIISSGESRESTLPKQMISNPDTIIENILTKLYANGIIENIIDVQDSTDNNDIKQNIIKSEVIGSTEKRNLDGSLEINATIDGKVASISSDKNGVLSYSIASGTGETKAISKLKGTQIILTDANILKTTAPTRSVENIDYDINIETNALGVSTNRFNIVDNDNNDSSKSINIVTKDAQSTSTIGITGDLVVTSKVVNNTQALIYTSTDGNVGYKFISSGDDETISVTPFVSTDKYDVNVTIEDINGTLQIKTIAPLQLNQEIKF